MFNPLPRDSDKTFSFPSQCVMLKFNGAWPLQQTDGPTIFGRLYFLWSHFLIILIALTCLAQSAFLFSAWGDILTLTECGCTVFMGIHNLLRLIHLSWKRTVLRQLIDYFVKNIWISMKVDKPIALKCQRDMVVLRYVSLLQFILIWMYILLPLLELFTDVDAANKPFPYKMRFPYDANHGISYALTYFLTSLAGFGVVTTLFSEDSLFGFFIAHTCGQFRLLHQHIDGIVRTGQLNAAKRYPSHPANGGIQRQRIQEGIQREYRHALVRIIRHHNVLIRFYELLQDFFSPILLVNYMISSLLICMVGLQIVAVKLTIADFLKLVVYIVSALSQLFILCWKGDQINEISLYTAISLYSCNWQGKSVDKNCIDNRCPANHVLIDCPCDVRFVKNLTFAIKRSHKPLVLRAMKFSALALSSFTRILSTSMSYFTLLQTLVERSE